MAVAACETGLLLIGWLILLFGFPDEIVLVMISSENEAEFEDGSWVIVEAVKVVLSVVISVITAIVFCVDCGMNGELVDTGLKVVLNCVTVKAAVEVNVASGVVPVLAVVSFVDVSEVILEGLVLVGRLVKAVALAVLSVDAVGLCAVVVLVLV